MHAPESMTVSNGEVFRLKVSLQQSHENVYIEALSTNRLQATALAKESTQDLRRSMQIFSRMFPSG